MNTLPEAKIRFRRGPAVVNQAGSRGANEVELPIRQKFNLLTKAFAFSARLEAVMATWQDEQRRVMVGHQRRLLPPTLRALKDK